MFSSLKHTDDQLCELSFASCSGVPLEALVKKITHHYFEGDFSESHMLFTLLMPMLKEISCKPREACFLKLLLHFQDIWSLCILHALRERAFIPFLKEMLLLKDSLGTFIDFHHMQSALEAVMSSCFSDRYI